MEILHKIKLSSGKEIDLTKEEYKEIEIFFQKTIYSYYPYQTYPNILDYRYFQNPVITYVDQNTNTSTTAATYDNTNNTSTSAYNTKENKFDLT